MAYIHEEYCPGCEKEVMMVNGHCTDCRAREASKKKRMALAALKGLTEKERLDRIEETLYDLLTNQPWEPRHFRC